MPTNDFLPFGNAVGANVMTQADYLALAARTAGFSSGTANSAQLNKAWRQASLISSAVAQFIVNQTGQNAVDDGTTAALIANLLAAVKNVSQSGSASYAIDTGSVNAYVASFSPAPSSLIDGMSVRVRIANTNLGASTLNINGLGAVPIRAAASASTPSPLIGFEMTSFYIYNFVYNAVNNVWILTNPGRYADVTGNGGSAFSVGPATQPNHAIQYGQATGRVVNQVFITANGTYTPTAGITYAIVECIGGGGGSAHVIATGASQFATTAGGQAGGYTKSKFNYAALAGGIACSIGNGGVGANAGGVVTSSNGGVTSFGSLVSAGGGSRSTAGILSTGTYLSAPQGTPTTATGSFLYQIAGQPGTWGTYSVGSGQLGGCGGSSPYGGGGVGVGIGATAVAGSGYGAGGGASSLGPSSASIGGAAGSPGVIIVTEYV